MFSILSSTPLSLRRDPYFNERWRRDRLAEDRVLPGLREAMALYRFAALGHDLAGNARGRLKERSAHFWPYAEEQSTLKGWACDSAWATFGGECTAYSDDRHTAERVPSFERLVLALESELAPRS